LIGATVGAAAGGGNATIAGGIIGGVASSIANNLVTDDTFTLIVDVQVSAKLPKGATAHTRTNAKIEQGTSTRTVTQYQGRTDRMQYRTRVISVANQANLKFATAKPILIKQITNSIASIF
jgi:hypothetical protein